MKLALILLALIGFIAEVCLAERRESLDKPESNSPKQDNGFLEGKMENFRVKRGYGHGGGGGGGHGGYGHGPGAGGGARGPVYFCGWVGSKMGSGGYGR